MEAAASLAADVRNSVVSSNGAALTGAATARDMALNARAASRVLQSAPTEARRSPRTFQSRDHALQGAAAHQPKAGTQYREWGRVRVIITVGGWGQVMVTVKLEGNTGVRV